MSVLDSYPYRVKILCMVSPNCEHQFQNTDSVELSSFLMPGTEEFVAWLTKWTRDWDVLHKKNINKGTIDFNAWGVIK